VVTICAARLSTSSLDCTSYEQHRELVASQARQQAGGPGGGVQAFGDGLQHPIAEAVTQGVVDRLEVVHIHEQQRQALLGSGARQRALQVRRQLAAVGQLRQRIVVCEVMQLLGTLGDVTLELRW